MGNLERVFRRINAQYGRDLATSRRLGALSTRMARSAATSVYGAPAAPTARLLDSGATLASPEAAWAASYDSTAQPQHPSDLAASQLVSLLQQRLNEQQATAQLPPLLAQYRRVRQPARQPTLTLPTGAVSDRQVKQLVGAANNAYYEAQNEQLGKTGGALTLLSLLLKAA